MIVLAILLAGLLIGTLLNVVVIRLPREHTMGDWPRCTGCGRLLAWWQIAPLAGWLVQAGRAHCCGKPLHWIFPLNELIYAGTLALLYVRYGADSRFFFLGFVAAVLVVTGAIDWLHRSIYTFVILGAALIVLLVSPFVRDYSPINALLGALVSGFAFVLLFVLARVLFPAKAAPFGLGDVYLGIFIGASVGLTNLMPALFYGIVLAGLFSAAILVARRFRGAPVAEYISYGSFLCLGALGYILAWGLR